MDKGQLDKLRTVLTKDDDLRTIAEYYSQHKASYTALSVRGVVNGLKAHGSPVGLPKARAFVSALVEAGIGKGIKDGDGNISNVTKMALNTREVGEAVVGLVRKPRQIREEQASRGIERAASMVTKSPGEFRIYPARHAGHLSISITVNGRLISLIIPDDTPPELIPAIYERLKKTDDSVYGK